MLKLLLIMVVLFSTTTVYADCSGFNWYHDINLEDCASGDIAALEKFIINSRDSLLIDMDVNFNGTVDILELGWQFWENGRLIHWICQEVPSPYYFYEYNCGLTGDIPDEISNLDALIKLRLQSNELSGIVPTSICNLSILNDGSYWFNLENNRLCPPYPDCIEKILGNQRLTNCK